MDADNPDSNPRLETERDSPLKILLCTPFYPPGVGGSSRLLNDIVDHTLSGGHHVEVLTYSSHPPAQEQEFDSSRAYPIHRVPIAGLRGGSSLTMLRMLVAHSAKSRYDLVLFGAAYPICVLGPVNQFLTKVPFGIYSHAEDLTCVLQSSKKRPVLSWAVRSARTVMTNSTFTLKLARELGASEERSQLCPPGIDPEPYETVPLELVERLRERLGLTGKRVILTMARLTPRKGHDVIIRALPQVTARIPDAHYLIVGKGDQEPLRTLANSLGVDGRVTFVEYLADEELPAVFASCDVHAMVSRWDQDTNEVEGFGIVYLEAAAAGKPSVVGNAGGPPDTIQDGISGLLVDPTSVKQVAGALIEILSDADRAAVMGAAGRRHVHETYRKDVTLKRIEAALQKAVVRS